MAEMATTLIYRSMYEAAQLADPEQRLAFYDQLLAYAFDGVEPDTDDQVVKILIASAIPLIDVRNRRVKGAEARRASVKTEEQGNKVEPCFTPSETRSDHALLERERREEKERGEKREERGEKNKVEPSVPPAPAQAPENAEEVAQFVNANNITNVDPERFFTYYAARGWAGIRDWKMAVRAWAANEKKQHPPNRRAGKPKNTFNGFAQHDYDFDAIEKELLKGGTQT